MMTSNGAFEGKTYVEAMDLDPQPVFTADDWYTMVTGTYYTATQTITSIDAKGMDTDSEQVWENAWTGSMELHHTTYRIDAKRPLSDGPGLTEGEDAWESLVIMMNLDMPESVKFTPFVKTVVGGAATLAAGATIAAS